MDAVGAPLALGRTLRLDGGILVLTKWRRKTRISVARVRTVDVDKRSLSLTLHDGSAYTVRGPSEPAVRNFAAALDTRIAASGGLTPGTPEVTTEVPEVRPAMRFVYGYVGMLIACAVALVAVGKPAMIVLLLPFGFLGCLGLVLGFLAVSMLEENLRHRGWPLTTATVLESGRASRALPIAYIAEGGRELRAVSEVSRAGKYVAAGHRFNLRYKPDDPLTIYTPHGPVALTLSFVFALGLLAGWIAFGIGTIVVNF
ncbi:hypothetical protein ACU686_11925 [Yinghuangia aomiensis]